LPMLYHTGRRRAVIYAPRAFTRVEGKTGRDLVIFDGGLLWRVVAVVDPDNAGRDAGSVLGLGAKGVPVVAGAREAMEFEPEAVILGAAPVGGRLPDSWLRDVVFFLEAGVDVYSGLHTFISDIPLAVRAAERSGARIVDVRKPDPRYHRVWDGSVLSTRDAARILVAGTDCEAGKNVATFTLYKRMVERGLEACMLGTGQTMLLLGARGLVVDAVPSDFVAGVVEKLVVEEYERGCRFIIVEGQAAISHEAYGHVSLGILRGVSPTHVVIAHVPGRRWRAAFNHSYKPLAAVEPREELALIKTLNPNPHMAFSGIMLNTSSYSRGEAEEVARAYTREYMVPALDPLRESVDPIIDRIVESMPERGMRR